MVPGPESGKCNSLAKPWKGPPPIVARHRGEWEPEQGAWNVRQCVTTSPGSGYCFLPPIALEKDDNSRQGLLSSNIGIAGDGTGKGSGEDFLLTDCSAGLRSRR